MKKTLLVYWMLTISCAYAAGGIDPRASTTPPKMGVPTNHAVSQTMELDPMSKQQALDAMRKAPDDTVFVFQGQRKTKAQLLSEASTRRSPAAPRAANPFEAQRSKLESEEDAKVQTANAQTMAEFSALKQKFLLSK